VSEALDDLLRRRLELVPREDRNDSPNSLCGMYVALALENHALRGLCRDLANGGWIVKRTKDAVNEPMPFHPALFSREEWEQQQSAYLVGRGKETNESAEIHRRVWDAAEGEEVTTC
jgi:hypothetical protein